MLCDECLICSVNDEIAAIDGIAGTETIIVTRTVKEDSAIRILEALWLYHNGGLREL
jgi:hypothetical protein